MILTKELEDFLHLTARAFAKTSGSETPHVFADTVLEHAKALDASAAPVEPTVETKVTMEVPVLNAASTEQPAA